MTKMLIPKTSYIRSESHRRFIASLNCCVCGSSEVQAAHIRTGNSAGMGLKSGDDCCLPLCVKCHLEQGKSEKRFWGKHLDAAQSLANALWIRSKDYESGMMQVMRFKKVFNAI